MERGNPNLLKALREGAKKVSESNGISDMTITGKSQINPLKDSMTLQTNEAGAYASIQRINQITVPKDSAKSISVNENVRYVPIEQRLFESVETLGDTKEYYNAVSSLFTLHTLGKLNEGLMDSISRDDLREIKSIIREFKDAIDSY